MHNYFGSQKKSSTFAAGFALNGTTKQEKRSLRF